MGEIDENQENPSREGERYADAELAKRIDAAPKIGVAEYRAYLEEHGYFGHSCEEIIISPLKMASGIEAYRARPGRVFMADADGGIIHALDRGMA